MSNNIPRILRSDGRVPGSTSTEAYTLRLRGSPWSRYYQIPYQWNLRRLKLGRVLEVGCWVGRNLGSLHKTSVGVDPNVHSVAEARRRGFTAYTPEGFFNSSNSSLGSFDSLLVAHVLEHLPKAEHLNLLQGYVRFIGPGGRIVLIAPQEVGFRSDPTHVDFVDEKELAELIVSVGGEVQRSYSFPFSRWVGKWFRHNEWVVTGVLEYVSTPPIWIAMNNAQNKLSKSIRRICQFDASFARLKSGWARQEAKSELSKSDLHSVASSTSRLLAKAS